MSTPLEGIIRPFQDRDVSPSPFTKPGQGSHPMVRVQIGYTGTVKTYSFHVSATVTTKMGQIHKEGAPDYSQAVGGFLKQNWTQQ